MQRRKFSREFKLKAVKLVREGGVSVAQAARDLDLHENVLRKWVREQQADPGSAFPGHGVMKPQQQEIEGLRRKLGRMKAERDILKKAAAYFVGGLDMRFDRIEASLHDGVLRLKVPKAAARNQAYWDQLPRRGVDIPPSLSRSRGTVTAV